MKNLFTFLFIFGGVVNRKQYLIVFPMCFIMLISFTWFMSITKHIGYFGNIANLIDFILIPFALISLVSFFHCVGEDWKILEEVNSG